MMVFCKVCLLFLHGILCQTSQGKDMRVCVCVFVYKFGYMIVCTYFWLKVMHSDLLVPFYRLNKWQKNIRNKAEVVDMISNIFGEDILMYRYLDKNKKEKYFKSVGLNGLFVSIKFSLDLVEESIFRQWFFETLPYDFELLTCFKIMA